MANEGHWGETHVNARWKELLCASVLKGLSWRRLRAHTKPYLWAVLLPLLEKLRWGRKSLSGSGPVLNLQLSWGEVERSKTAGSWLKICPCARTGKGIKQNKTRSFCSTVNNSTTKRKARYRLNQDIARPLQFHFIRE